MIRLFANPYFLLTLACFSWGGNAVAGRMAADVISPAALSFSRWVGAILILLIFARGYVARDANKLKKNWKVLAALGGVGYAMFNIAMYIALNYTTALNVAIEQAGMPVLIVLANYLLFKQTIKPLQIAGIFITIFGVLITATRGDLTSLLEAGLNRGDAIMLIAVLIYAAYAIGLRYKPADMHWVSFFFGLALSAMIVSGLSLLFEIAIGNARIQPAEAAGIIAFVIVFPSLIAQISFIRGVELIGSNRAGLFINTVPIFGALLAVLILGERFQTYHAVGLLLVLGGIALAEYSAQRRV